MNYHKTKADRIYDRLISEHIFVRPSMDCYTELKEGVSSHKFMQIVRKDQNCKRLDEWADQFGTSVSRLIEYLGKATAKKDREGAVRELMEQEKQHYMEEVTMSNEISVELEVQPKQLLKDIPTEELLKELSRRSKGSTIHNSHVRGADDFDEDPRKNV